MIVLGWHASARAQSATDSTGGDSTHRRAPKRTPAVDTTEFYGAIDPGEGITVAKTDKGTLAVSIYSLWRYLNQLPVNTSYTDHLGVVHVIDTRNDFQWQRILLTFKGWIYLPKLNYAVTCWTVNSTAEVAIVGNFSYDFSKAFVLAGGINGLPGTRSLLGSHPYWLGTDRFMADEFFRPGFTSGVWATGEPIPKVFYRAMVGNSITQVGITAGQLTRNLATSASVWWLPTTGEFGPRGGFGDYEHHDTLAVRIGTSYTHSHENRFAQLESPAPDNAQIRLSDGVLLFQTGSLGPDATISDATYQLNAFDGGLKYKGAFLQTEWYMRRLDRFVVDTILPINAVFDWGYYVTASYMAVPRSFELFTMTSQVYGQFNRSWEFGGGFNWYPDDTRNMRVNLYVTRVNRSPTSSLFGYYIAGLSGPIVGLSVAAFY